MPTSDEVSAIINFSKRIYQTQAFENNGAAQQVLAPEPPDSVPLKILPYGIVGCFLRAAGEVQRYVAFLADEVKHNTSRSALRDRDRLFWASVSQDGGAVAFRLSE